MAPTSSSSIQLCFSACGTTWTAGRKSLSVSWGKVWPPPAQAHSLWALQHHLGETKQSEKLGDLSCHGREGTVRETKMALSSGTSLLDHSVKRSVHIPKRWPQKPAVYHQQQSAEPLEMLEKWHSCSYGHFIHFDKGEHLACAYSPSAVFCST